MGHFGSFLGHFGSFWVILGPFWAIWGHIWATLGHFGSFLGHFVAFLKKFAESSNFFCGIINPAILAFRMYEAITDLDLEAFQSFQAVGDDLRVFNLQLSQDL